MTSEADRKPETLFRTPGKYRRAFDWRVSIGGRRATTAEFQGMARLASSDFPDILEDFLEISRKRKTNPTALARLQMYMLEELLAQEGAVQHYKSQLKDSNQDNEQQLDVDDERRVHSIAERELFFHRMYANAIRIIGDGLAWRALGFDRAATRLLSERATQQHLHSEGTVAELREWSLQFDRGEGIAILNSLTNCLAFGDITLVRNDGSVEIIEVKSSNTKSGRKIRQKQAMSEVVTLLASGEGTSHDKDVKIEILPVMPETGLDQVEELIGKTAGLGWAAKKISNCLYVEAFDLRRIKSFEAIKSDVEKSKRATVGAWEAVGDLVVDGNSLDHLAFSPNYAPFSIFPFSSRTCIELAIGAKLYVSYLNLDAVAREFRYRGWEVERTSKQLLDKQLSDKKTTEELLVIRKGLFHASVPPADFARMTAEALRPKTLIEAFEFKFQQGPGDEKHGYLLANYEGERTLWN